MLVPGLILLVCVLSPVEPACGPVEEGQPTTLTCEVNTADCSTIGFVLTWRAETTTTDIIRCNSLSCGGGFSRHLSATIGSSGGFMYSSTLTIKNVSKSDPFNMETKWSCVPCGTADPVTVCDPLQVYDPLEVTFTKDSTSTTFSKGNSISFTCSTQGNPDPFLTLTRERSGEILANVQTTTLTHTLDSLDCLDTGVYVCSGQTSQGTNSKDISINVRCPQQLSPTSDPQFIINAVAGDTVQIDIAIYGFPEPRSLFLQKTINGTNLTPSPRHITKYTPKDAPFGVVTVTIFDVVETDYTYYTLAVDNGVEEALTYTFYLNKVKANQNEDKADLPQLIFIKDSTKTSFTKGDTVRLACAAQGNPDTSLTLTRNQSGKVLANVQTGTLTHTLDSLDCLDTGVYVCSARNSRGTNYKNISINIRCPQQFRSTFYLLRYIDVLDGDTAQVDLEIYGFPEPSSIFLQTTHENIVFASSPRHTVKYTASDVPFGVVTVTIFDIVEVGSTNYTLTVDNGVRDALKYTFYLKTGTVTEKNTGDDSPNIAAIIIGVIGVVIVAIFIVIVFLLVRRIQFLQKRSRFGLDAPGYTREMHNKQTLDVHKPRQLKDSSDPQNLAHLQY